MAKTVSVERAMSDVEQVDFGVRDDKGRAVGARITYGSELFKRAPDNHFGAFYDLAPGRYLTVHFDATRAGKVFGAYRSRRYFRTEEERTAAREAYIAGARKRAEKKWAGRRIPELEATS